MLARASERRLKRLLRASDSAYNRRGSVWVLNSQFFGRSPSLVHLRCIEESRYGQMHSYVVLCLVLPEPAVNAGRRRGERTIRLPLANLVVEQIALEIVRLRFHIRFAMKLELKQPVSLPCELERCALLHVVFDLEAFVRMQADLFCVHFVCRRLQRVNPSVRRSRAAAGIGIRLRNAGQMQ